MKKKTKTNKQKQKQKQKQHIKMRLTILSTSRIGLLCCIGLGEQHSGTWTTFILNTAGVKNYRVLLSPIEFCGKL